MIWDKIKIVNVKNSFKNRESKTKDITEVTLLMPTDTWRDLKKQIEVPNALRGRRADDTTK